MVELRICTCHSLVQHLLQYTCRVTVYFRAWCQRAVSRYDGPHQKTRISLRLFAAACHYTQEDANCCELASLMHLMFWDVEMLLDIKKLRPLHSLMHL